MPPGKAKSQKGITSPYGRFPAGNKRITSSAIKTAFRTAINEEHISFTVPIPRVFPGDDPIESCLDAVLSDRKFINDGLANSNTGLSEADCITAKTLGDFEACIEAWYKRNQWTVVPD